MGWCSGTTIFDAACEGILTCSLSDNEKVELLKTIADAMEDNDWDCQQDSRFYDDDLVRRVFLELHPDWEWLDEEYEEEEE